MGALATAAVNAHQAGVAAMREERDRRFDDLWSQRLTRAHASAADAIDVARDAVARVHDLEAEVIALRRAVASRDTLIRRIAANG